jgi:hypothetical protein
MLRVTVPSRLMASLDRATEKAYGLSFKELAEQRLPSALDMLLELAESKKLQDVGLALQFEKIDDEDDDSTTFYLVEICTRQSRLAPSTC